MMLLSVGPFRRTVLPEVRGAAIVRDQYTNDDLRNAMTPCSANPTMPSTTSTATWSARPACSSCLHDVSPAGAAATNSATMATGDRQYDRHLQPGEDDGSAWAA